MSALAAACRDLFGGPNPANSGSRLADAAPRASRRGVVDRPDRDLRPTAVHLFRRRILR